MIEIDQVDDHAREKDHEVEIDIGLDQIEQRVNRHVIETSVPGLFKFKDKNFFE